MDADSGTGGRLHEKMAIISKGWACYLAGEQISQTDLALHYGRDKNDNQVLKSEDEADFGGIDCGAEARADREDEPTEEEKQAEKQAIRKEHAEALAAKFQRERESKPKPSKDGKPPAPKLLAKPLNVRALPSKK